MDATSRSSGGSRPLLLALVAAVTLTAFLALVTFGVTATVAPRELPLVLAVDGDGPQRGALERAARLVEPRSGEQVSWRAAGSAAEARALLDDKQAYGALVLSAPPGAGAPVVTVLVNGGMNAPGAQLTAQVLPPLAQQVASAGGPAAGPVSPVRVQTVNPASGPGRTVPVAASALLWIAALVAGAAGYVLLRHARVAPGRSVRLRALLAALAGLLGAAVVAGFVALWDSGLDVGWPVLGFLVLVGTAFALLAAAVLAWLGLRGMALLGPLYLLAPAVAGQPPELLDPAYRVLLWSWSPFRFSAEGLRSLLFFDGAPGIGVPVAVFTGIAVLSLALLLAAPRRAEPAGEPAPAPAAAPRQPAPVS